MSDLLKNVVKEVGNEYASIVADGVEAGDVSTFIDTGSHVLKGLLSGSLYGGLPANKITALAGESATGKTYFLMGIVKNFLDMDKEAGVIYFEIESAITKQMVIDRGIDVNRIVIMPVTRYWTGILLRMRVKGNLCFSVWILWVCSLLPRKSRIRLKVKRQEI